MSTTEEEVRYNFVGLSKDTGLSVCEIKFALGIEPTFEDLKSANKKYVAYCFETKLRNDFNNVCMQILESMTTLQSAKAGFGKLNGTRFSQEAEELWRKIAIQKVEEASATDELLAILEDAPLGIQDSEVFAVKALGPIASVNEFLWFYKKIRSRYGLRSNLFNERAKKFAEDEIQVFDGSPEKIQLIFELLDISKAPTNILDDFCDLITAAILREDDLAKLCDIEKAFGYRKQDISLILKRKIYKAWEKVWQEAKTFEEAFQIIFEKRPQSIELDAIEVIAKLFSLITGWEQFQLVIKMFDKERIYYSGTTVVVDTWLRLTLQLPEEERYKNLDRGIEGKLDWLGCDSQYVTEAVGFFITNSKSIYRLIDLVDKIESLRPCRQSFGIGSEIDLNLRQRKDELSMEEVNKTVDLERLLRIADDTYYCGNARNNARDKATVLASEQISNCNNPADITRIKKMFKADSGIVSACDKRLLIIAKEALDKGSLDTSYLFGLVANLPKGDPLWIEAVARLASFYKI